MIEYRIVGNFHELLQERFLWTNIRRLLASGTKDATSPNFVEKTLQIATKAQNLLVFFLTSFPLNSIVLLLKHYPIKFLVDYLHVTEEGLMKLWCSRKDDLRR